MKRILCIDGGGVRGAIAIQILKRIEQHLQQPIFELFDLYSGTSIGGVIVNLMMYGKYTATFICDTIFQEDRFATYIQKSWVDKLCGLVQCKPKYNNAYKLAETLRWIPMNMSMSQLATNKYVMISMYNIETAQPKFVCSWKEEDKMLSVVSVTDATSSAPAYWGATNTAQGQMIDGGIFANNPVDSTYIMSLELWKSSSTSTSTSASSSSSINMLEETLNEPETTPISPLAVIDEKITILSLGTGYFERGMDADQSTDYGGVEWLINGDLVGIMMEAVEKVAHQRTMILANVLHDKYVRVNDYISEAYNITQDPDIYDAQTIHMLKIVGDEWWEKYQEQILSVCS